MKLKTIFVIILSLLFLPLVIKPAYAGERIVLSGRNNLSIFSYNWTGCEIDLELVGDGQILAKTHLALDDYWELTDLEITLEDETELELRFITIEGAHCSCPGQQFSSQDPGVFVDEDPAGEWHLDWSYWGGDFDIFLFFYAKITVESPQNPVSVDIDIPEQLSVNESGWYSENPTELQVNLTNNSSESLVGKVSVTFSNSERLLFNLPEQETYIKAPTELSGSLGTSGVGLEPGQSQELVWPLWVQPMEEQEIELTAEVIDDLTGQILAQDTAIMKVPTAQIHPVIVVPGLMGSWKNFSGQWEIDPLTGRYDNLLEELRLAGYEDNLSLFTFPYDWRQHTDLSASQLSQQISGFLSEAEGKGKNYINTSSVDLVAHSLGGLVSRAYIQGNSYQDNVHRLITLGTPHRGAPEAYLGAEGLEYIDEGSPILRWIKENAFRALARKAGYCTNQIRFKGYEAVCWPTQANLYRYISERVPSSRELFPDSSYLQSDPGGYLIDNNNPTQVYPFGYQENSFLDSLNSNIETLISRLGASNVIAVVGNRKIEETDRYYRVVERDPLDAPLWNNGQVLEGKTYRSEGFGDLTVPIESADLSLVDERAQTFILNSADNGAEIVHGKMPTQLQQSIVEYLSQTRPFFSTGFLVKYWDKPLDKIFVFYNLSPVEIQVIDPLGRRAGVEFSTGNELTEIPEAFFSRSPLADEPDWLFIPEPIEGEYQIKLLGISEGEYRVGLETLNESESLTLAELSGTAAPGAEYEHQFVYESEALEMSALTLEEENSTENSTLTINSEADNSETINSETDDSQADSLGEEKDYAFKQDKTRIQEAGVLGTETETNSLTASSEGEQGKKKLIS